MGFREDYVMWRVVYQLLHQKNTSLVTISQDQREVWLEEHSNKIPTYYRLISTDINWSNELKRNLVRGIQIIDKILAKRLRKQANVEMMYFSPYEPVDDGFDWEKERIYKKTSIQTTLWTKNDTELLWNRFFPNTALQISDEYDEVDVQTIKLAALQYGQKEIAQTFQRTKPFVSYVLLAMQIFMFLVLERSGGSTNIPTLIQYGVKVDEMMIQGEWWRLVTPVFLHIGFLHLVMNSLGLYFIGTLVEQIFGKWRFLFIYLLAGVGGTAASFAFTDGISAGASGAIFGLFGALLYFGLAKPRLFFRTMGMNVLLVIAINIAIGFTLPGIDNAGHLGGLLAGFLASGTVKIPNKKGLLLPMLFTISYVFVLFLFLIIGVSME
ncbi:rhomboid family intramembrane serine protease [Mangrovibacillus cuniculi]|uniref:Rhomboid family intramembrane serine protease n=1 Tax=Mangrovibacillus cuniculi TaxID=2593652 RepID=A0A7S8CBE3_9BACI|nr:rhomboid family intramembrane serine protease [Mangrovibacillus cuniculi]QPC46875.1 rhomboid family intramembrane serine protease [Mangrovibacillus cuniculi]